MIKNKNIEASLKYIKGSFYKLNLVANLVRGLDVKNADAQLLFSDKRIAISLRKLLQSCIANAKHNFGLNEENLFIKTIDVGRAFALKRSMPCGRGKVGKIEKRYSNVRIILEDKTNVSKEVK